MIVSSKQHKDSAGFMWKLLNCGFNVVVRLLTGLRVYDIQCRIKAIRREAFKEIFRHLNVKHYALMLNCCLAKLYGLRVVKLLIKVMLENSFSFREVAYALDLLGIAYGLS